MKQWITLFLLVMLVVEAAATVRIGSTRREVFGEFGRPVSHLYGGETEICLFADGTKVKLFDGRVVAVERASATLTVESAEAEEGSGWQAYTTADAPAAAAEVSAAPAARVVGARGVDGGTFAQLNGLFGGNPMLLGSLAVVALVFVVGGGWAILARREQPVPHRPHPY